MDIRINHRQGDFRLDVAFKGSPSGVTALYGDSGAGKTSVINMVAGLMRPDEGRIAINGLCLFDSGKGIDVPPEKRRIGYVFQEGRLLPHLSVRSNLVYGMNRTPADRRFVGFDQVVDLLGIRHLLLRRPARLSGGEKQRVAIGRALLTSPAMLLMDEPLASLDAARKAEVLPFITRLSREFAIPILYVSHAMDEILNLANRIVVMENGRVLAEGGIEEIYSRHDLQTRFNIGDISTVITMTIALPDDGTGLTLLRFGDQLLEVQGIRASAGDPVRVRIPGHGVAIALDKPDRISFRNVYRSTITEIHDAGSSHVDVALDINGNVWARITRQSCLELSLYPGMEVFAIIKQISLPGYMSLADTGQNLSESLSPK